MKMIAYLRVSTGGQAIENQRLAIFEAGYNPNDWIDHNTRCQLERRATFV